jgi:hypothetical protein
MIRDLGLVPDTVPEGRDTVSADDPEGGRA